MTTPNGSTERIKSFINRSKKVKTSICELVFFSYLKPDCLDYGVNMKDFRILFVMCEKAKHFYMTKFFTKG